MSKVITESKQEVARGMIPLNLQYFADTTEEDDDLDNNDTQVQDDGQGDEQDDEKTFTQSQVTAMLTKEKKEGRRAAFRSLGFKNETEAKSVLNLLQQLTGSQKESSITSEASTAADNTKYNEALERAEEAESKLACITAGVNKESIDDALAIAKLKVSEEKNLETVLNEMSKEAKYASFFGDERSTRGTGSDPGHLPKEREGKTGSYGARLANSTTSAKENKQSSYFKH